MGNMQQNAVQGDQSTETAQQNTVQDMGNTQQNTVQDDQSTETAQQNTVQDMGNTQQNTVQDMETAQQEAVASIPQYYVVERGDTLRSISYAVYGNYSMVDEICEWNRIEDPDSILCGQRLLLP